MKIILATANISQAQNAIEVLTKALKDVGIDVEIDHFESLRLVIRNISKGYEVAIISKNIGNEQVTVEILDQLTDEAPNVRYVPLIDQDDLGSEFIGGVYGLGIYSALTGADANPKNLVKMIKDGRLKADAKKYYRLTDQMIGQSPAAEKTTGPVIDSSLLSTYIASLRKSKEVDAAYEEIVDGLNDEQNRYFVEQLPRGVKKKLVDNAIYRSFAGEMPVKVNEKVESGPNIVVQKTYETAEVPVLPSDYKKVIVVLGMETGVGATTVATEMAEGFAGQGIKTGLIDMDLAAFETFFRFELNSKGENLIHYLYAGSAHESFGEQPIKNLSVYSDYFEHRKKPFDDDLTERFTQLVRHVKDENQVVILDVTFRRQRTKEILNVMSLADECILVLTQNAPMLSRLHVYKDIITHGKYDFVINMYSPKVKTLREKQIGNILDDIGVVFGTSFVVPFTPEVHTSLAKRETVTHSGADEEFCESVSRMCEHYFRTKKKKGLLGLFAR